MSDTPIQPAGGSVTASGVVAAMALSLTFAPVVGAVSLTASAPAIGQQTSTAITPTVGAFALAGVAPGFSKPTVTSMVPTVASLALAGVAPSASQVNQAPGVLGVLNMLVNASTSGTRWYWPGGKGLFAAVGTFGGATVTLNILGPDGATMVAAATVTTLTAAGVGQIELPPGIVQAAVTSGSPSGLYATLSRIPTVVG